MRKRKTTQQIEQLPYKINQNMFNYMKSIRNINLTNFERKTNIFSGNCLKCVNSSITNDNYYMLDKYNLVIRRNEQNSKKTCFGWKYDENHEPINIHINPILLSTNSSDIQIATLKYLKEKYPNQFKRGVVFKVYSSEFPKFNIDEL